MLWRDEGPVSAGIGSGNGNADRRHWMVEQKLAILRHTSATDAPTSACHSTNAICSPVTSTSSCKISSSNQLRFCQIPLITAGGISWDRVIPICALPDSRGIPKAMKI